MPDPSPASPSPQFSPKIRKGRKRFIPQIPPQPEPQPPVAPQLPTPPLPTSTSPDPKQKP